MNHGTVSDQLSATKHGTCTTPEVGVTFHQWCGSGYKVCCCWFCLSSLKSEYSYVRIIVCIQKSEDVSLGTVKTHTLGSIGYTNLQSTSE